jgi:uracil-DNA glycosylase family protein
MAKLLVQTALPLVPTHPTVSNLRKAAADCTACPLYKNATQTVFGEGPAKAKIMLVGEVPGNDEDLQGRPFVGPAGRELQNALQEIDLDRRQVYITNVVKHFKWKREGKRRIHQTPNAVEIAACRPWFEAEVAAVQPRIIVLMGATAAKAVLGRDFRVTQHRGELLDLPLGPAVMATIHPSAILRNPDENARHEERRRFVEDLRMVLQFI